MQELGVRAVINFWPKIDPDWGSLPVDWYWFVPSARSATMMESRVLRAAVAVADYLRSDKTACTLVLCEAGKTRSVFFSVLVVREYMRCTYASAEQRVLRMVPNAKLKSIMVDWLHQQKD